MTKRKVKARNRLKSTDMIEIKDQDIEFDWNNNVIKFDVGAQPVTLSFDVLENLAFQIEYARAPDAPQHSSAPKSIGQTWDIDPNHSGVMSLAKKQTI